MEKSKVKKIKKKRNERLVYGGKREKLGDG